MPPGPLFAVTHELSLQILNEFKLINFFPLWNHQKTFGFQLMSGRIEVNQFT